MDHYAKLDLVREELNCFSIVDQCNNSNWPSALQYICDLMEVLGYVQHADH